MLRFTALLLVAPMVTFAEPIATTVEAPKTHDVGRLEFTLYPVVPELNGKFTQHLGTMAQLTWHLREHFGLTLVGGGNWLNRENDFNAELAHSARVEAQWASSQLRTWTAMAGVEVAPFSGTFSLFGSGLGHFSVVINAGAGLGGTRHQLRPAGATPATYGDTGTKFMAGVGAGVRLVLGEHVAVRLEVRDVVFSGRVTEVNGCRVDDLDFSLLPSKVRSSGCSLSNFESPQDAVPASALLRLPSSAVIHSVGAWAGVSFLY